MTGTCAECGADIRRTGIQDQHGQRPWVHTGRARVPLDHPATPGEDWTPSYAPWRHGGWYVTNVRWPSGACGCVSRNYPDGRWRIVCDPRPEAERTTYPSRAAAARAERTMAAAARLNALAAMA